MKGLLTLNAKIITLFNHKGGVSKTTTTFNIGWALTDIGKRVLLVDGDPQCNLSSLLLGDAFDDYYMQKGTKELNIKDGVKVAFEGKPKPISAIECFKAINNDNLFLIPGHMDLSEYDSSLSLSLNSNNAISTLQNLPGAFYELIRLCAEKYNVDYVFIDMNPGLSAINQTLFMYSDAFIIPTNPDPFSIMALKTLNTVLPRWKKWADQSRTFFEDASYPLPNAEMKFVGEIIQRFNLRRKKAANSFAIRIDEIRQYIEEDLVTTLSKHDMVYDVDRLIKSGKLNDHCLAEIPDFGSILQKANDALVPVFTIEDKQLGVTGPVLAQMQGRRENFKEIFSNIADVIVELVK
jgi:cellulose biosynthesis protein BcsQ